MDGTDLAAVLERLEGRLSRIEATLSALDEKARQAAGAAAVAVDMADEALARDMAAGGPLPDARVQAAAGLLARLTLPETADRLGRLLDRLDEAETALHAAGQLPGVIATAADTLDEVAAGAVSQGVLPEERLRTALALAERLTRPEAVDALNRLTTLLPELARAADAARQLPGAMAAGVDTFDAVAADLAGRGIDLDERVRGAADLLERLTRPEVRAALLPLLDRAEALAGLTTHLATLPGAAATAVDALDEAIAQARADGLDVDALLRGLVDLATLASRLFASPDFRLHVETGVLAPPTVRIISAMGASMVAARREGPSEAGVMAVLRAMGEPEVRRALGFALSMARHFGRALGQIGVR